MKLVFGFACRRTTACTCRHGDHIKTTSLSHSFPFPIKGIWLSLSSLCHAPPAPSPFFPCIPCGSPDIPEPVSTSQSRRRHVCQVGEQVSCTALQADSWQWWTVTEHITLVLNLSTILALFTEGFHFPLLYISTSLHFQRKYLYFLRANVSFYISSFDLQFNL